MKKLCWNVYVENFNKHTIEPYNIFSHASFLKDIEDAYNLHKNNFAKFDKTAKTILMYYFWSKCEWEIVIDAWPFNDSFEAIKVNVYDQVMLNWDIFIEYVWRYFNG